MRRIDNYFLTRRTIENFAYRLLRQIAKVALVSLTFFSTVSGSVAAVSTGDGLPLGCCQFFDADANPFATDFSNTRSIGFAGISARKSPAPLVTIVAQPSSFQWHFDYPAPAKVESYEMKANCFMMVLKPSAVESRPAALLSNSLSEIKHWFELQPSLETQANISLIANTLATEVKTAVSAWLLQQSPLPIRAIRLIERAL